MNFALLRNYSSAKDRKLPTEEIKRSLPHLKRFSLLSQTPNRSTFGAVHIELGKPVILRIFRPPPLGSDELFHFYQRFEKTDCDAFTEVLEIGEIKNYHYEILARPPGNTLEQLIGSGHLELDSLWQITSMVNHHAFRLHSLGLPYPPPADRIYVGPDGKISALLGPSDLITEEPGSEKKFKNGDTVAKKYLIKRAIGEGGSSEVFEAQQLHPISQSVALKISKSNGIDAETQQQFEVERCNLMRLSHPDIARILDAGFSADGQPFLAVELVKDGIPLTAYCSQYNLPLTKRLQLFVSVCDAIGYAHDQGIIHRDLKPTNILVSQSNAPQHSPALVKILDFGISCNIRNANAREGIRSSSSSAFGTPPYMAPEQKLGLPSKSTDVFALGRILSELIEQNSGGLSEFSQIEAIALKAQSFRSQDRHNSVSELATEVNEYLSRSFKPGGKVTLSTALDVLERSVKKLIRYGTRLSCPSQDR